ncbi:hypothetical protein FI667_g11697, partial [Globisporangium splendens]
MSFLVEDDTLEVALAFIDACDGEDALASGQSSSYDSPASSVSTAPTDGCEDTRCEGLQVVIRSTRDNKLSAQQQQRKDAQNCFNEQQLYAQVPPQPVRDAKGRSRDKALAVSRLRARKKAEMLALRSEVVELQEKLSELQNARQVGKSMQVLMRLQRDQDAKSTTPRTASTWLKIAAVQARERFKSEALNGRLKDAVERQMQIHKALRGFLDSPELSQIVTDLQAGALEMYRQVDQIVESFRSVDPNSKLTSTEVKQDPLHGTLVQMQTQTPLRGGFHEAGLFLWSKLTAPHLTAHSSRFRVKNCEVTESTYRKSYMLMFDTTRAGPVEIHGIMYVQRFDEPHHVALTFNSIVLTANNGLRFRENCWMVVSASPTGDTQFPTVLQTSYQVFSDTSSSANDFAFDADDENETATTIKEVVLDSLSERAHEVHKMMHEMMPHTNQIDSSSMSFLVEDDTLEVALAFIDACDGDIADAPTVLSPSVGFMSLDDGDAAYVARRDDAKPGSLQVVIRSTRDNKLTAQQKQQTQECSELQQQLAQTPPIAQEQPSAPPPLTPPVRSTSDRARRNASAVNRLRARKKAEALSLRNEVAELQEKLLELQHAKRAGKSIQALMRMQREQEGKEKGVDEANNNGSLSPKAVSVWLSIAAMQAQQRFKSEALNVKLKSAVERQLHIHKALRELISKPEILEGFNLCWNNPSGNPILAQETELLADLQAGVLEMYCEFDRIVESFRAMVPDSMMTSTEVKEHPLHGTLVQIRAKTPLRSTFRDAGHFLWRQLTAQYTVTNSSRYCLKNRQATESTFHKSYMLTIDTPQAGLVELHGVTYVQRFDEPHRVAMAFNSIILTASNGLRFREKGWVVTCNSAADNTQFPTVFQNFYQVFSDTSSSANDFAFEADDENETATTIKEVVLDSLSDRTRRFYQEMHETLHNAFSGFQLSPQLGTTLTTKKGHALGNELPGRRDNHLAMNFLVEEDTLEFALAFIDTLDVDDVLSTSPDSSSSSSSSPSLSPYEPPATLHDESIVKDLPHPNGSLQVLIRATQNQRLSAHHVQPQCALRKEDPVLPQKQSDRPRSNAAAVKRLRARKKAEAIALRNEVIELEAKLARLQHRPRLTGLEQVSKVQQWLEEEIKEMSASQGDKDVSIWLDMAARQARERFESEALNIKLRDAIEKQLRITKSLQAVLGKRHGFDLLWPSLNQNLYNDAVFTNEDTARAELRGGMDQMYLERDLVAQSFCAKDRNIVTSTMDTKEHPFFGCFEKSYVILLDGPTGPFELHGVSLIRKYDEPHRTVFIFKSLIYSSVKGLVFRENGWVIASSSPSAKDAKLPTAVQVCHQLLSDPLNEEPGSRDPEREQHREIVMRSLGNKTWAEHQKIQNLMVKEFA